jgi:hypothetical protein
MATVEECRAALQRLSDQLAANAKAAGKRLDFDRTLACRMPDLGASFHGRLVDGRIVDLTDGDNPTAKLKLTSSSDDLIALVDGKLSAASAWAGGRLKIDASFRDLVKLRKLL